MGGVRRSSLGYGELKKLKDRENDFKVSGGEFRGRNRGETREMGYRGDRDGESKDWEIGFKVCKGEFNRLNSGERSVMGCRGDRDGESKDRITNCEDIRVLSSKSGGVGLLRDGDREPGELSSDSGSDGGLDDLDLLLIEKDIESLVQEKKRKCSPIIRERGSDINCVSSRPGKTAKIEVPEHKEPTEVSNDMEVSIVEDEDFAPLRNIRSSRWADDFDSPSSEEAIYADEEMPKLKNNLTDARRIRGCKSSLTPELGVKSMSESDERVLSSSRDSCSGHVTEKNDTEGDEDHHYDGGSASQSDTELEDAHVAPKPGSPLRRNVNMLHGCRSVDEFERLNKINEGTYGIVYRARDKKTGEIVALKKVKMEKEREGFPLTALREINILLSFDHSSIVDVKEIVVGSSLDDIFLVMEYMEHDLRAFLQARKQPFSESEVKGLMLQLLKGTKYLHDNWVLHRDLKTSNLLLNNDLELKICDFGLARQYGSPLKPYTQLVVTLSYRAPELLLGAKQYSTAIDMWSLGCIMGELLSKQTLFNGKSEIDQIDKIFRTLGTPNDTMWPGYSKLPGAKGTFVKNKNNMLRKKFPPSSFTGAPVLSDAGFDLLSKLLTYDPKTRISAEAALEHKWFQEVRPSKDNELLPTFLFWHGQDRQRMTKGTDPLKDLQSKELQQWGSKTGGVFG